MILKPPEETGATSSRGLPDTAYRACRRVWMVNPDARVWSAQGEAFLPPREKDACCLQGLCSWAAQQSECSGVRIKAWVQICGSNASVGSELLVAQRPKLAMCLT